ncbi:MAG: hypothetical protein GF417_03025 [Candidatus Latescibacteria bacterium]|nr:hypothetical protein [bacterium]MBD3423401.1 hypothetical protein [Candidatus Latescibacterota bacterium]
MSASKVYSAVCAAIIFFGLFLCGCEADSSYEQRSVVYVSNINQGGGAFFSDVLNQGDTLFVEGTTTYQTQDDFVEEDNLILEFTNKPYSGLIDVDNGALSDFLVTGYEIVFEPMGGADIPVESFSGKTSILVPANTAVEAAIMIVPFQSKNRMPLMGMRYTGLEILSNAHITFRGHEVRTDRNYTFEAGLMVNFGDELTTDQGGG